jgi:hypothetical protein
MQADAWGSARAGCDFPGMRLCAHHSYMPGLQVVRMAPASGRVRCSVPGICSRHAKLRMQWALLEEPRSVSCALCNVLILDNAYMCMWSPVVRGSVFLGLRCMYSYCVPHAAERTALTVGSVEHGCFEAPSTTCGMV